MCQFLSLVNPHGTVATSTICNPINRFLNVAISERNIILWPLEYKPYRRVLGHNLTVDDLYSAFRGNLEYVLSEVELLLRNVDTPEAAITSDLWII